MNKDGLAILTHHLHKGLEVSPQPRKRYYLEIVISMVLLIVIIVVSVVGFGAYQHIVRRRWLSQRPVPFGELIATDKISQGTEVRKYYDDDHGLTYCAVQGTTRWVCVNKPGQLFEETGVRL